MYIKETDLVAIWQIYKNVFHLKPWRESVVEYDVLRDFGEIEDSVDWVKWSIRCFQKMGTASPIPFANKIHIKVPTTFRRTFFSMCPEPSGHRYRPIFRSRSQFDKPFGSLLFFPWSWLVISWLSMSTKKFV